VLAANSTLEVASGALVYGGVDWVASAISADENAGAASVHLRQRCAGHYVGLYAVFHLSPAWLPGRLPFCMTHTSHICLGMLSAYPPTHPPTPSHPPTQPPTHPSFPTHPPAICLRPPTAWLACRPA
jgi:hypothetical protein